LCVHYFFFLIKLYKFVLYNVNLVFYSLYIILTHLDLLTVLKNEEVCL
jgi:hypothetical protein